MGFILKPSSLLAQMRILVLVNDNCFPGVDVSKYRSILHETKFLLNNWWLNSFASSTYIKISTLQCTIEDVRLYVIKMIWEGWYPCYIHELIFLSLWLHLLKVKRCYYDNCLLFLVLMRWTYGYNLTHEPLQTMKPHHVT